MTEQPVYRIEDLSHRSGATVRTIRAYQDRGLLPKPERRGRANVYRDTHLARLRQIGGLLDRGYTLASIKELLDAWDTGRGLGGVLGLVAEVEGPWTDERPTRVSRAELTEAFGGADESALEDAVELGVLERLPDSPDAFLAPSPQLLAVASELRAAGVPLEAVSAHLRELRAQVEHIAGRFLDFTTEHVFRPYLDHPPSDEVAAQAADLVRRLRPLASRTVDAELARAMRTLAVRHLRTHLEETSAVGPADSDDVPGIPDIPCGPGEPAAQAVPIPAPALAPDPTTSDDGWTAVRLPSATVREVRALVGPGDEAMEAFIGAAAEREVRARTMDALASHRRQRQQSASQLPWKP